MTKTSLRVLAILQVILALKIVWVERTQHAMFEHIGSLDAEQMMAQLKRIYEISRVVSWSVMALSMVALVMYAIGSKKKLAISAAAAYALHVTIAVVSMLTDTKGAPPSWLAVAWWASGAV